MISGPNLAYHIKTFFVLKVLDELSKMVYGIWE